MAETRDAGGRRVDTPSSGLSAKVRDASICPDEMKEDSWGTWKEGTMRGALKAGA